jgi:hypothetical protein
MPVYKLNVLTPSGIIANYHFDKPPIKVDLIKLRDEIWSRLSPKAQDELWDLYLLFENIPDQPFASFYHLYGRLNIEEIGVIPTEPRD